MATRIRYIGKRDFNSDTLFKTNLIWYGEGDVQVVEDDVKAKKMAKLCPLTYEIVPETERKPSKTDDKGKKAIDLGDPMMLLMIPDPQPVGEVQGSCPARNASRFALVLYAESLGMSIEAGRTREEVLEDLQIVLSDKDSVKAAADLRAKESDEHAHEKHLIDILVGYMVELNKSPSINVCRKLKGIGKIGLKRLNAKTRDQAWFESRAILEKKEFETTDIGDGDAESKFDPKTGPADTPESNETETF